VTYELANALLVKTEIRGEHATGFWSCERNGGRIFFDKEPVKSSIYATRSIWANDFADVDSDLLLGHCRFSTANSGHERYNKNNHPHTSDDLRVALVHNGKIPEYSALKSRYRLRSDCDSEILLSMFESGEAYRADEDMLKKEFPSLTTQVAYRMMGLREVFSRVNYGAMAVAIGERGVSDNAEDHRRALWLFRDEERPLHVVDLRKTLGQIFYCSTAEIWKSAVEACPSVKSYIPADQVIIEFPAYHVWMLEFNPIDDAQAHGDAAWASFTAAQQAQYGTRDAVPEAEWKLALIDTEWLVKKFRITKTKFYDYQPDGDNTKLPRPKADKPIAQVISRLGKDEEVESRNDEADKTAVNNLVKEARALVTCKKKVNKTKECVDREGDVDESNGNDDYLRRAVSERDTDLGDLTETNLDQQEIDMAAFDEMIKQVRQVVSDIEINVTNLQQGGSLSDKDFAVIMESLKDVQAELKGSLMFIK
jgi:hypothetical protein